MSGTPLGNMVIKLGLDDADFGKGVENSKKQVKYLAKEMQANGRIADLAGNKLGKLGSRYEGLTKIIKAQEEQVSSLKKAVDGSFVDGKATESTKRLAAQYEDARSKLVNYNLQLQQTAGQMARLKVETQGVTGWMNKHGETYIKQGEKIQKFGEGVSRVGSTLTKGLTVPIAAGFTLATKKAADFTTQIGEIGPLLTNGKAITAEYQEQLDKMGDSSKQWAKDYGISTTDINTGLAEIVRKGYDANQTMGVMPAILDATKASGDAFNDVMNVTTEVISQFNLKGKDYASTVENATRVTDSLTFVANATSAGFSDLGLAMGYVGPVANSLNMSVEETASAIGLLSDAGIGGEKAGTALRGALTRLLKPSKQNIEGFEQLGVSVDDFKNGTLSLPDILDNIKTNTEGWTDAQRTAAIALAFGTESQSAMNVLVGQGGDALRGLTTDTLNASGATKQISDMMQNLPANKVAKFKESLNVLAITFGEKLLPLATPWIEKATDMVNSFSELDDATQNNIVKWGLMAAAAGPVFKLLGGGISVIGNTRKGIGLLNTGIVKLVAKSAEKRALASFATSVTQVGTAATVASGVGTGTAAAGGVAGLGASLAAIAGPAAIGVLAIGAVAGAVYLGKKAYDEHQLAGAKWGTEVTKEQDKVIEKSYELQEKAVANINAYGDGVAGAAEKAIESNQKIVDSIQSVLDKEIERKREAAKGIEDPESREKANKSIDYDEKVNAQIVKNAQSRVDKINKIVTSASKNSRKISDEERQYINANYEKLSKQQLEAANFSAGEIVSIQTAYQDKLSSLSTKQLQERSSVVEKALKAEQTAHEKQLANFEITYGKDTQAYKAEVEKQTALHKEKTNSMIVAMAKLEQEQGFSLESMSAFWERYGYTTEEVARLVNGSIDETTKNLDMFAKGNHEADISWNELAFDPKTGEVKTNMADTLLEIAKADDGWKQLEFIAKNADLTTNAREEIAVAMGEADKWQFLTLEDKRLLLNNDEAKIKLYDSINELGLWNAFNADRKLLGVENADAIYKIMDSTGKLNEWNSLPPDLKTLIADNPAKLTVEQTKQALDTYNALPPNLKTLLANNTNAVTNVQQAQNKIIEYNNQQVGAKHLHATANYGEVEAARNAIAQVYSKNVVIDVEYRGRRTGHTAIPNAQGTNYHPGGDMIVNDQKGPLYKEIVHEPGKTPYIPVGRNVYIPNAKKGTKVYKASKTKSIMQRMGIPKYAEGIGIPENSTLIQNMRSLVPQTERQNFNVSVPDNGDKLDQLINIMSQFGKDLKNFKVIMDSREVTSIIKNKLEFTNQIEARRGRVR